MGRIMKHKAGQMFVCIKGGFRYFHYPDLGSGSHANIDVGDVIAFIDRASFDNRIIEDECIVMSKYGIMEIIGPHASRWARI